MTDLRTALQDYLTLRRRLGFALERAGVLLPDFLDHLDAAGATRLTRELALSWATQPATAHPAWWRERLGIVRGFATYLRTIDPATDSLPQGLLSAHRTRIQPYLYSADDIVGLLGAASTLCPTWRVATYQTLVGLLAVTGLRLGEALGLDRNDVDLTDGVVIVRRAKLGNLREVPLHETTMEALRRYRQILDQQWPEPSTPGLFISTRGSRLSAGSVHHTFPTLIQLAGLEGRGARCRPRPHDLRHSFAVRTLLDWYQVGAEVEAKLPLLSTWLGHVDPADTYWYLQAAPELLAIAGQRLEHVLDGLS